MNIESDRIEVESFDPIELIGSLMGNKSIVSTKTIDRRKTDKTEPKKDKKKNKETDKKISIPKISIQEEYKNVRWSPKQKQVIEAVKGKRNIFLTGCGGVGKSFLLRYIIGILREGGLNVSATGSSGIAAVNIQGTTLHGLLGLGTGEDDLACLIESMLKNTDNLKRWRNMDVLIIDEISMLNAQFFVKVDQIARIVKGKLDRAFGGIQVIVVGDFCQLPPVIKTEFGQKKIATLDCTDVEFCFETVSWIQLDFLSIELDQVYRQDNRTLVQALSRIRFGEHTRKDLELFESREDVSFKDDGIPVTYLHAHNKFVDAINKNELEKLPGDIHSYEFSVNWDIDDGVSLSPYQEQLMKKHQKDIIKNCIADNIIILKKRAFVILLANIDQENGLVNGSRGTVIGFDEGGQPRIRFENGYEKTISPHKWPIVEPGVGSVNYWQTPLKLAWAVTIHKSQGLTLTRAIIYMDGIFEYGQAYVALSRIQSLEGLCIKKYKPSVIKAHPKVVYFYKNNYTPARDMESMISVMSLLQKDQEEKSKEKKLNQTQKRYNRVDSNNSSEKGYQKKSNWSKDEEGPKQPFGQAREYDDGEKKMMKSTWSNLGTLVGKSSMDPTVPRANSSCNPFIQRDTNFDKKRPNSIPYQAKIRSISIGRDLEKPNMDSSIHLKRKNMDPSLDVSKDVSKDVSQKTKVQKTDHE